MKALFLEKSLLESICLKTWEQGSVTCLVAALKGMKTNCLQAREEALAEMGERAAYLGADAVIGSKMDYEVLGSDNGMLMVTCSGTAVRLK